MGVWACGGDESAFAGAGAGAGAAVGRVDAGFGGAGVREDDWRCDPACEPAKKLRISPLRGILTKKIDNK